LQVSGLSEVFCLTDPNQEDNPIIYASEEFYHMTGYSRDFVIGTNCRFLQGPKTKRHSVQRLRRAIDSGQELSEALLNYRRDGRPFMNILMIAPLHDNKGNVKYHIGAQVDASGLIEGGKGLDGFEKYLANEQAKINSRGRSSGKEPIPSQGRLSTKEAKKTALEKLGELSEMFDLEENVIVAQRSRSNSRERRSEDEESTGSGRSRRVFAESTESESDEEYLGDKDRAAWTLSQTGSSGKLPGVYESYFLMRPSPSLKIIFASPALRKMGNLVQSTFLSHVTAPLATLKGLRESFEAGNPVTAKVLFSAKASESKEGRVLDRGQGKRDIEEASSSKFGRSCWISATPLFGSDDEVGVWMVVLVDQRSLGSGSSHLSSTRNPQRTPSGKAVGDQQSASSEKPTPTSASASISKPTRPSHINMPDRLGSRQEETRQANGVNRSSAGQGSPQPRKSSMMPQRTKSSHDTIIRGDERLYREQHPMSSSLPLTPQPQKESAQEADEFVRRHEPRNMSTDPGRVHIQPDTDEEDEDFTLANETEACNNSGRSMTPEGHEKVPVANGSVPGDEADTVAEKESNVLARAEPDKTTDDSVENIPTSSENQDVTPGQAPESTSKTELQRAPAPALEPLSEQALEIHNREMSAKEDVKAPVEEPQAQSTEEPNMSPSNQVQKYLESDPDPPVFTEAGPEEGAFEPTNVKDDHKTEHGDNGDDTIIATDPHAGAHGLDESYSESGQADSKTASGYMDYLRHPGSRPGSKRGITVTNLGSQGHTMGELGERTWERHEDPDCDMRTPFSVD
jgi:PAS domain S-box-containing protein